MVGSAIWRYLESKGYTNLLGKSHNELDLRDQASVKAFFNKEKPEFVFLAAAKVGGILANDTYRANFIYDNLQIQNNVIHQSYMSGVKKLLFLGSSCIYPKDCPQPIKEEFLLTGPLEPTNEPYAIAKIAGIKMCENYYSQYGANFISVMPTNLYGANDNFNLETSHALPAILRKTHLAKCLENNDLESIRQDLNKRPIENINGKASNEEIIYILNKYSISLIQNSSNVSLSLWGTGNPKREFLYVDDMTDACVYVFEHLEADDLYSNGVSHINIGTGIDITISELAEMIKETVGYSGKIEWDSSKPDGTLRKLLNVDRLKQMRWKPVYSLKKGLEETYRQYANKGEI
jgi:GDP-L-fucose synthase